MNQSRHFVGELRASGIEVEELDRRWVPTELTSSLLALRRCIRSFRPVLVHSVSHHCNHLTRFVRFLSGQRFRLLTAIRTEYDARQLRNERLEQRFSTFVVCNSPSMAAKLHASAGLSEARLRYIPNGLDVAHFGKNPDPSLRSSIAPGKRHVALMLARITEQKSPDILARAVGELRIQKRLAADCDFWIVGERESEEVQGKLDRAIREFQLEDCVRQFPATTQPAAFLHAANFSVLASLWEGTPNSVLESLAAGKPALVSEAANASGLIRPGEQGWSVATGGVSALAAGLESVLALPEANLSAMRPSCEARAAEFDLPTMVSRYQTLYLDLLSSR